MAEHAGFYQQLPKQRAFSDLARPDSFAPLPSGWVICCTDIVSSTELIAAGRYKTVNMVGASVIAAMMNALGNAPFPYSFGGDGASFAVPPEWARVARETLARLREWVLREFAISLRAAQMPIERIRAEGLDVTVARYAVSEDADYAMFSGGGLSWAEQQMKSGAYVVAPAEEAGPPDLTGLSCRWDNTPARNGLILSLVALPAQGSDPQRFAALATRLLELTAQLEGGGHPVPQSGPRLRYPPSGLMVEARLTRGRLPLALRALWLIAGSAIARMLFSRGKPTGGFDPAHYLSVISANSDFRKFDDGLKMTVDCSHKVRDQIILLLEQAEAAGEIRFGLHEQDAAMVTCIVPSAMRDDHVHFVDGASGGYTRAAADLHQRASAAAVQKT
ncbi:DUF3095 domain-containing protein [Phycobacter sp. K97]|uniref:DUF3095 domain-containing protein n=1 Tax=Phycobacter sedimenti TaxID=3133977 RepID=UPI00311E4B46